MLRLGFWQLQRAEEKDSRLANIASKSETGAMNLKEVLALMDRRDAPITLQGELIVEKVFLWDNRVVQGKVGYEVIVPVKTNTGIVLTNLGWIAGTGYRDRLPDIPSSAQLAHNSEFNGVVWLPSNNVFISDTLEHPGKWPAVVQQVNIQQIEGLLGEPLLPFVVALSLSEDSPFVDNHKPVVMPPEKHIAYAIQWFGLAIGCLLVFIFASMRKGKNDKSN